MIIKLYYEGFSITNILFATLLFAFIILMYSSAYIFVREKLTLGESAELIFVLAEESEPLKAKLISITKEGDYIVEPIDKENTELLLNRDYIKRIIYNKPSST